LQKTASTRSVRPLVRAWRGAHPRTAALLRRVMHTLAASRAWGVCRGIVETPAVDQLREELEAARLAIASLLAVITDEQFSAVETALEALVPISDPARAALEELRSSRDYRRTTRGKGHELRAAIESRLEKPDEPG
jgi:hypothetical protein